MRYAILKDGIVKNIIEWDGGTSYTLPSGASLVLDDLTVAEIDGSWDGSGFSPPPVVPQSSPVPAYITRRQCALQLLVIEKITSQEALDMTKTAAVPAAIATVFNDQVVSGVWTPEQRTLAEIDFAADNYYRSNSLLGIMGLTNDEIDAFFIAAGRL